MWRHDADPLTHPPTLAPKEDIGYRRTDTDVVRFGPGECVRAAPGPRGPPAARRRRPNVRHSALLGALAARLLAPPVLAAAQPHELATALWALARLGGTNDHARGRHGK